MIYQESAVLNAHFRDPSFRQDHILLNSQIVNLKDKTDILHQRKPKFQIFKSGCDFLGYLGTNLIKEQS